MGTLDFDLRTIADVSRLARLDPASPLVGHRLAAGG